MKKVILLLSFLLLCCCSLRKKETTSLSYDSLSVKQLESRDSVSRKVELELQHTENRHIEIYATAPYRWHPDSGLTGGAGYLKVKIVGQSSAKGTLLETEKRQLVKLEKGMEKINVAGKSKAVTEKRVPFKVYVFMVVGVVFMLVLVWVKRNVGWYS